MYAGAVGDWVVGGDVVRKIGSGVTAGGLGAVDAVQSMGWEETRAWSDYEGSVMSDLHTSRLDESGAEPLYIET